LPSQAEWNILSNSVGGSNTEGKHLKAKSGWNYNGNGLDTYGFAALPGGYGLPGGYFNDVGDYGFWWSDRERNSSDAYIRLMYYDSEDAGWLYLDKGLLSSVRAIEHSLGALNSIFGKTSLFSNIVSKKCIFTRFIMQNSDLC
jgi:uncharacterized protein (TIGR02145 family)